MSGHNKWSKIHRKKGLADAEKGNIYARISKEILVAVKQGGSGDPSQNSKLREILIKARSNNMPNDIAKRAIAKALGDTTANNYENITYEGYGTAGIAVIVEALTNNKNRTAGDIRSYFDKSGGALGVSGAVSYMFNRRGVIEIPCEGVTLDKIWELLIDSPVEDITEDDGFITVTTRPENFNTVIAELEKNSIKLEGADIEWVPAVTVALPDDEAASARFNKLIENLESNEDIQNVFHNAE
jgi:YebC/PmpR family DNA-binding regulatory protein